jgi:glutathione synthase
MSQSIAAPPAEAMVFVVNDTQVLSPTKTTSAIVARAAERRPTFVVGAADLALDDGGPRARLRPVLGHRLGPVPDGPPSVHIDLGPAVDHRLGPGVPVFVRTNPASGMTPALWSHALRVLDEVERVGGSVLNPPAALRTFATKTGLLQLPPSIRPTSLVCARADTALEAMAALGRAVVKPVGGSQGSGVFLTGPDDPNRRTAVELLLHSGPVVVQSWIDGAEAGDVRLFLIDGEPLLLEGVPAAIARVPNDGELRSNVHLGATPRIHPLTPELQRVADLAGPVLRAHGVAIAGLDCIQGQVVEVNACAPGGLTDLAHQAGIDALGAFVSVLEGMGRTAGPPR